MGIVEWIQNATTLHIDDDEPAEGTSVTVRRRHDKKQRQNVPSPPGPEEVTCHPTVVVGPAKSNNPRPQAPYDLRVCVASCAPAPQISNPQGWEGAHPPGACACHCQRTSFFRPLARKNFQLRVDDLEGKSPFRSPGFCPPSPPRRAASRLDARISEQDLFRLPAYSKRSRGWGGGGILELLGSRADEKNKREKMVRL